MTKTILLGLITVLFISCVNDDNDVSIKQEEGEVWLSGGLGVCAAQIHLDNGDTLIVHLEDVLSFRSGDRVSVKYEEIGPNESCSSGTDCEVIVIKMIQ